MLIEFKNQEKDAKENKRQIQKQRKKTKKERQVLLAITQSTELCYASCCAPNGRCVHQKTGGNEFTRETTVQAMPRPERLELSKPSVKADLLLVAAAVAAALLCAVIKGAIVGRQQVSCLLAVALY